MVPLLHEFRTKYPSILLYSRGNSGFASPKLYEVYEEVGHPFEREFKAS